MTTYIDFPEKIRSTRADGKLVDGPAIDGLILDAQFPDGIMRDIEFNATSVRMMLGLTAQEVTDILTGLVVASGMITITQNDGTATPFTLPAGTPDGVVASGAFNADSTELVITLEDGTAIPIDVPDALRSTTSGVDQTARDSADAAAAAGVNHAASQHNQDDTARADVSTAQTAAENAQAEGAIHAALPHNQDQVARDGAGTAQVAANAAGAAAMDANAAAVTAGQNASNAATDAAAATQTLLNHIAMHPGSIAVFLPNADGSFPAVTQDMYDDGAVLISPRRLRVPFRYPDGGITRNMAFWGSYAPANFYTVLQYSNFPLDAPDGSRGYTTYNHGFWMKENGQWLTNAPPPGTTYLGEFTSNGLANDAVSGNNQLAYFSRILHVSSNYVAGGDATYALGWTADAPVPHRLIESEAKDQDSDVFGEISGAILDAVLQSGVTWDYLQGLVDAQPSAREKEAGTNTTPRPFSVKDVSDVVSGQGALSQLFEKEQEVALHSDDEFLVRTSTQRVHLPVRADALDVLNVPRGGQAVFFLARTADYLYTHHLTAGDDQVERYEINGDGTPLTNGLAASIDGARNQVYQGSDARAGFDVDPSTSEFMTIGRRDPNGAVNPTVYKWAYADEEVAQVYVDADRTTVIPNGNLDAGNPSPYAMAMATLEADDATGLAAGQYCLLTDNGATSKGMVFVYRSADGVAAATHLKTIDFSGDVDTTFFNPVVALAVKLIGTRLIMFASAAVSSLGRRLLAYDVNTGDRVTEAEIAYGSDVWFGVTIGADGILYGTVEQPTSFPAYRAYSFVESGSVARAKHGDPEPFRTTLRAKPAAAAKIGRIVRHYTLDTSLLLMNSDDDVELVLETGGATGSSLNLNFVTSVRVAVGLLRTRTPSTLTDGLILTNANNDFVAADAGKYIPIKIDRGNANDAWDFGHDTLWVGRVDNTTLCVWAGNLVPATTEGWAFVTVNRLQYGSGGVSAPASAAQQLVDGGTIGGYYFGVFYQQATNQPAFNGLPGETGSWSGLSDWKVSRATAVDATSTDPVWIAYASGFIDDFNVTYPNSPQVFAEFATQYSDDGFVTVTNVAPTNPNGWWRRDRLPGGGVTAAVPLYHAQEAWEPVWSEVPFYTRGSDGTSEDFNLDLSDVVAMRFTLTAFGRWTSEGNPERRGAICTDVMPRPPEGWSTSENNNNERANDRGLYSVYYHESAGLVVHAQDDGSQGDFNIPVGSYRSEGYPARSWACAMKMIAPDNAEILQLSTLRIFDAPQHYERFLWTIEVMRG